MIEVFKCSFKIKLNIGCVINQNKKRYFTYQMFTKIVSILFALLIFFQSVDVSFQDLAEIDDMIAHAQYHKEKYGDDIGSFLSKHYGALKKEHSKNHDEEKPDHDKLPFKHHRTNHLVFIGAQNFLNFDYSLGEVKFSKTPVFKKHLNSELHSSGIFHPPKSSFLLG